jgi:hypothetical protein
MRDFGVIFERVPLMCNNTSAISVAKNLVFHKKLRHVERIHHFLRDHIMKGDIEMRYIDIERQLADIFTKPLIFLNLVILGGRRESVFAIHMDWFERELVLYLIYLYLLLFYYIFFILT